MPLDPYAKGLEFSARGEHARAIGEFERALALRPNDPAILFALGNTARALDLAGPAEAFYRRVLALEPLRLEALVNLANLLRHEARLAEAEALIVPGVAASPASPELWLTLGSVYREMGKAEKARDHYRHALGLKPGYSPALANLADLAAEDGAYDEALDLYDRALKREPNNAQAKLNRALTHLVRGDLKQGWRDYAARLKIAGRGPLSSHGLPRWTGNSLKRVTLLVTAEQGVGDQTMFASLIPALTERAAAEGGRVIVECEPRLHPLFARSFPGATVMAARIETREGVMRADHSWLKAIGGANAAIEIGSLPRYFLNDPAALAAAPAYLTPDSGEQARWRSAFASLPRPWIGICWRSGLMTGARAAQYAPLAAWGEFLKGLKGTVIAAQYAPQPEEIAALGAIRPIEVPAGLDQKNELDRTAAMLSVLDAVVSAPTAVAWLAAGTGVATCKVQPDAGWTAFGQTFEPFAPAARAIVPAHPGDWADAFRQVQQILIGYPAAR